MKLPSILMVQLTPHNWQIRNQAGVVLQTDITAHSAYEANEYAKRWVSSFSCWDYELVLLEKVIEVPRKSRR